MALTWSSNSNTMNMQGPRKVSFQAIKSTYIFEICVTHLIIQAFFPLNFTDFFAYFSKINEKYTCVTLKLNFFHKLTFPVLKLTKTEAIKDVLLIGGYIQYKRGY